MTTSASYQSRTRQWQEADLVDYFEAYLQMKSSDGLKKVIQTLNRMSIRKSLHQQVITTQTPGKSLLKDFFFSIDVALILVQRRRNARLACAFRYFMADSSPQGNNNWLLSKSTTLDASLCLDLVTAANFLATETQKAAVLVTERNGQESDEMHDACKAVLKHVTTLGDNLIEHCLIPASIGLTHENTAHKAAAFLHSCMLELDPGQLQDVLINTISFTSDLGVEVGVPGFRSFLQELLPQWRQQCLQQLVPEDVLHFSKGQLVGGIAPCSDSCQSLQSLQEDVELISKTLPSLRALQLHPEDVYTFTTEQPGGSAPEYSQLIEALQEDVELLGSSHSQASVSGNFEPGSDIVANRDNKGQSTAEPQLSLLSAAWQANPSWHAVLLPFAISIPGMMHITHNLLADVDCGMTYWITFWEHLQNVSALLSDKKRLEKFRVSCIDAQHPEAKEIEKLFSHKLIGLYSKRWGCVSTFIAQCDERIQLLAEFWDHNLYNGGQEQDDGATRFSPKRLTSTVRCRKFLAYCDAVRLIHSTIDELAGWSEGCFCHPPWVGLGMGTTTDSVRANRHGAMKAETRKALLNKSGVCPMQGRRAPELATGSWKIFYDKMIRHSFTNLAATHQRQLNSAKALSVYLCHAMQISHNSR